MVNKYLIAMFPNVPYEKIALGGTHHFQTKPFATNWLGDRYDKWFQTFPKHMCHGCQGGWIDLDFQFLGGSHIPIARIPSMDGLP